MRTVGLPVRWGTMLVALSVGALLATILISGSAHARATRASACANATTAVQQLTLSQARAAVECLINQQRAARGLPALSESAKLDQSAQGWALHMVRAGIFAHDDPYKRISAAGYNWQVAGENIATSAPTAQVAVRTWMASLTHCRNILNPAFRDVGTGETPHAVRGYPQRPATWDADFGLRLGSLPASHNAGPMNGCPYH